MKKFLLTTLCLFGFLMVWQEPYPSGEVKSGVYKNRAELHFELLDLVPHPCNILGIWDTETGKEYKAVLKTSPIIELEQMTWMQID